MASDLKDVVHNFKHRIKITKWKVCEGNHVSTGTVLFLYNECVDDDGSAKLNTLKFRCRSVGTVHKLEAEEGSIIDARRSILKLTSCKHPTVMKDLCAECGADLRLNEDETSNVSTEASVSMIHSVPELKVSHELAIQIGKADEDRLIKANKLVLLVDLDQTLIHTTNDIIPNNIKDVYHFQLYGPNSPWYHTRLRPGTRQFLENISKLYELHICTFGVRPYAHMIANILDKDGKYFAQRILSRDECFNPVSKTANLKALFPCGDSMVCIIDDREDVWNYSLNLVHVKPYHFFQHTGDINAPPGLDKTEQDSDEEEDNLLSRVIKSALNRETSAGRNFSNFQEMKKKLGKNETSSSSEKHIPDISKAKLDDTQSDETDATIKSSTDLKSEGDRLCQSEDAENSVSSNSEENKKNENVMDGNEATPDEIDGNDIDGVIEQTSEAIEKMGVEVSKERDHEVVEKITEVKNDLGEVNKVLADECLPVEKGIDCEETKSEMDEESVKKDDQSTSQPDSKSDGNAEEATKENNSTESGEAETDSPSQIPENMVEVEDNDDYLLYLEDILNVVHKAYYKMYEQTKRTKKPDLKNVVPYVRMKVLKSLNIVFSGVIPTNMSIEKNRAYTVAKSLGANVQQRLVTRETASDPSQVTTHLIAAQYGTMKVNEAKKIKGINIVNIDWLWNCSERWERVDERLFPLKKLPQPRKIPTFHKPSPSDVDKKLNAPEARPHELPKYDRVTGKRINNKKPNVSASKVGSFASSYNPLLAFSSDDIANMDKEVEDVFNEESDGSDDENKVAENDENSSSGESLSGARPRGWKRKSVERWKDFVMSANDPDDEQQNGTPSSDSEGEPPNKYQRIDNLDADSDFEGSVGSVDEEMAAAIEKELLDV